MAEPLSRAGLWGSVLHLPLENPTTNNVATEMSELYVIHCGFFCFDKCAGKIAFRRPLSSGMLKKVAHFFKFVEYGVVFGRFGR